MLTASIVTRPTARQSHHFVPQFLLKPWATRTGALTQFRFVEARGEAVAGRGNIRSACQIENLYALQNTSNNGRFLLEDKYFSKAVDMPASHAHNIILNQGVDFLSKEQRRDWIRFLITLAVRMPTTIIEMKYYANEFLDQHPAEYERLRQPYHPTKLSEFVESYQPKLFNDLLLLMLPGIIAKSMFLNSFIIDEMEWWTRKLERRLELVVGDAPLLSRPEHSFRNGVDLSLPDVLLALPIAPQVVFFASACSQHRKELRKMPPSQLAALCNAQTVKRCHERVFGTEGTSVANFVKRAFADRAIR